MVPPRAIMFFRFSVSRFLHFLSPLLAPPDPPAYPQTPQPAPTLPSQPLDVRNLGNGETEKHDCPMSYHRLLALTGATAPLLHHTHFFPTLDSPTLDGTVGAAGHMTLERLLVMCKSKRKWF